MAAPTDAKPEPGALSSRPGWPELRRAEQDLHAAELLLGDPLAPARTAAPHLHDFWQGMVAAGRAAQLGEASAKDPGAWLEGELPGFDTRAQAALQAHWRTLAATELPSDKELRAHARAARKLLAHVEPIIGGVPLRKRRHKIAWTVLGLVVLFGPPLAYVALHTEIEGDGPWRAAYHSDRKLESAPVIQREQDIDHNWEKKAPHETVPPEKFSVRWDTCLRIDEAGPVSFLVNANDGARVFVDGETVIDVWDKDPVTRKRGSGGGELELDEGVHHLRVEYFESLGTASIKFSASLDGEVPVPLPRDRLSYPGNEYDETDPCAAVR